MTYNQLSLDKVEYIRKSVQDGKSLLQISKEINTSHHTVYRYCKKLNIHTKRSYQVLEQNELKKHNLRKCRICNQIKEMKDFYNGKNKSQCRECLIIVNSRIKEEKYYREVSFDDFLKDKFNRMKKGAISRNLEVHTTIEDIKQIFFKQDGKCFYSNEMMSLQNGELETLSIDRIDSSKNYTVENIVLCCWVVNKMKQDLNIKDFIKWIKLISNKHN